MLAAILLTITCGAYFVLRELGAQIEPCRSFEVVVLILQFSLLSELFKNLNNADETWEKRRKNGSA